MKEKRPYLELVPNISVGPFKLGSKINRYLHLQPETTHFDHIDKKSIFDSYDFYEYGIFLTVQKSIIRDITCKKECFWKNRNIMKMNIEEFLTIFELKKPPKDIVYTPAGKVNGQNQEVYDFDGYGLQIWVWRKKIVTVIVSNERRGVEEELMDLTKQEFASWASKFEYCGISLKTIKIKRQEKGEKYQSYLNIKLTKEYKIDKIFSYKIYDNYKQLLQEDGFVEFIRDEFDKILSEKTKGEEHSKNKKR